MAPAPATVLKSEEDSQPLPQPVQETPKPKIKRQRNLRNFSKRGRPSKHFLDSRIILAGILYENTFADRCHEIITENIAVIKIRFCTTSMMTAVRAAKPTVSSSHDM